MPAPRKPNTPRNSRTPQSSQQSAAPDLSGAPQLIDPRWILKALAVVLAVALLLSWGTLCLLWYQGQWQLVLHPSRTVATTPASVGLQFTELHFADDTTGLPQLNGWLISATGSTLTPSAPTALLLHSADGSIADALSRALTLHNAGLNVLLFDYRGYGRSVGQHPTETTMQQDAEAALNWLISTQHIPPQSIILYGNGIGASLAVTLAAQRHDIPAIILDAPDGDLTDRVAHDPHSSLVPARFLFNQTFPLAEPLRTLTTPKLLISYTSSTPAALTNAADPKVTAELPSPNDPKLIPTIQRFLDQYDTPNTHAHNALTASRLKGEKAAGVQAALVTGGEGGAARGSRSRGYLRSSIVLHLFRRNFSQKVLLSKQNCL
jgi:pimeloyl-ACP methyl ester carboxylesterase